LRESLAIRRAALGETHWQVAETKSVLGAALATQGQRAEAQPLLSTAYEVLLTQRGPASRVTREARARLER